MALAAGSRLGPYDITGRIGSGSMGEVWRARDTRLNRDVAIKTISTRDAGEEALHRFEQEAQSVSALNHPNILTVHDVGRDEGIAWIVTELIDGSSLRSLLHERGALPERQLLDIAIQIGEGLAAAHDAGIIHRDLKPENIMITRDGRVKILDFGIAKVVEEARNDSAATLNANQTAPGLLLGTTAYMSPEQARGTRVTYWTDQFSYGLILYEMATGVAPFRRDTGLATLSAILTEEAPLLETGSPLFQWLVRRLLHKEPDHRYASMHDVLRELRAMRANLTEPETAVEEVAASEPEARATYALPMRLLAAVLLGAVLLGAMVVLWRRFPPRMQVDLRGPYRLFAARSGLDVMPAWSPDGRLIAWSSNVNGVMQLFVASVAEAGSAPLQLTTADHDCLHPEWSENGSTIRYESGGAQWTVSAAGGTSETARGGFRPFTQSGDVALGREFGPVLRLWPQRSPDGKSVAFASAVVRYQLLRVDRRSGKVEPVLEAGLRATRPVFLGNGMLAWVSGGTVVMSRAGALYTHPRRITGMQAEGRHLLLRDDADQLWVLNVSGGSAVRSDRAPVPQTAPVPPGIDVEPDALPGYPPIAGIAESPDAWVVSVRRAVAEIWIAQR